MRKQFDKLKAATIKNNIFVGRSDYFDCNVDKHTYGGLEFSADPKNFAGILMPDFSSSANKYTITNKHGTASAPAIYGRTCVFNNHFQQYNGKCGNNDQGMVLEYFI